MEETKQKWTTDEMIQEFDVIGFGYGYCAVRRKSDKVKGSVDFEADEKGVRQYFDFREA